MKKTLLSIVGFVLLSSSAFSQTKAIDLDNTRQGESVEYCIQHKKQNELIQNNPGAAQVFANDELIRKQEAKNNVATKATVLYIPVVFHILHDGGNENISSDQVIDALEIMNRDYALLNADANTVDTAFTGMPANVDIQFRFATIAPDGTCFSGITRTQNALTYDGSNGTSQVNAIKAGNDVYNGEWPGDEYLNIFVCDEIGGAAGYTYNPNNWIGSLMNNGIWVLHTYTGSIGTSSAGSSRTLTHEVGHWLNLAHVWGPNNNPGNTSSCSDDDSVQDTPTCIGLTACNLSSNSCNQDNAYWGFDKEDNTENYMDYSYCSKMFTQGQVNRMRSALQSNIGGRSNISTASNLINTGADGNLYLCKAQFSADRTSICAGNQIQFTDESYNVVNGWTWTFPGGTPPNSTSQNPLVTYSTPGLYQVTLSATDGSNTDNEIKTSYIRVLPQAATLPFLEGFESYSTLANIEECSDIIEYYLSII